jgi:hypothetical protein
MEDRASAIHVGSFGLRPQDDSDLCFTSSQDDSGDGISTALH